jgi:small subunit ribosomal protein S2
VNGRRLLSALAETDSEKQINSKPRVQNKLNPLIHADFFNVQSMFTIRDLLEARVHLGHSEGSLNDGMKPYIYGSRLGHTIFDLDQTAEHLRRALNVTAHIALQGGIILLFGRSSINAHLIEKTATECGEYAHTKYWRGGTFTNSKVQFKAVTSK